MKGLLVDYGVGNIHSVRRAFDRAGAPVRVAAQPSAQAIARAPFLVLPGVGSFTAGSRGIAPVRSAVRLALEEGKPALGICLGMQLLFERSAEGPGKGLGFLEGEVAALRHRKLPQVGWNEVAPSRQGSRDPLFEGLGEGFHAYYVNSYAPKPRARGAVLARSHYGSPFAAVVRRLNTYGAQFHPEKSSDAGLRLVRNFVAFAEDLA
jgi:imidazole glycerol-phosphate synthase subunit HisH